MDVLVRKDRGVVEMRGISMVEAGYSKSNNMRHRRQKQEGAWVMHGGEAPCHAGNGESLYKGKSQGATRLNRKMS